MWTPRSVSLARALSLAVATALCVSATFGCSRGPKRALQIKGSDTMVNLGSAWAEAFMAAEPGMAVAITGGGSGTGIAALINGSCDAAQSSRAMKAKEKRQAAFNGRPVQEIPVAIDCIAVVVHPSNPVREITLDQLAGIFKGEISSWAALGGPDRPIDCFSRERNSGTHHYFLEDVVRLRKKGDQSQFAAKVAMMPSSQSIYDEVAQNPGAIGYYGLGYLGPKNRALAVARKAGAGALPSVATALNGAYPIARPLFLYVPGEIDGALERFVAFVLSDAGQAVALAEDFVPLRAIPES